MGINKSEINYDGTNIFVANDPMADFVADATIINLNTDSVPAIITFPPGSNDDIVGPPPENINERDRLDTPVDISFNQIDFYTPDGTYLPSLEIIINTLVEGAEEYVVNYTKVS